MNNFYKNISEQNAIHIVKVPLESTIHCIYENKYFFDQVLMGMDEASNAIILAEKSNPAKIKPYTPEKIDLLNEIYMESYFNQQSETPPKAVLVTTHTVISAAVSAETGQPKTGPGWYGNAGNSNAEGTGAGFEPPPNFNVARPPYRAPQWHGYGCRCLTGNFGGTGPCGGFGTWAYGDPVYP